METARSNCKVQKLISLEYIEDYISRMNTYNNINIYLIYNSLEYLAFEGTVNVTRENNVLSDFPDIRLEAVRLLGQLTIIEARMALFEVLRYESDTSVLHEAIRSLFLNWSDFYGNVDEIVLILNAIENINIQHK